FSAPKLAANNNTCEDCNRQLCSASNLKRHRATCKIVMQKQYSKNGGIASPVPKPVQQQQKWQPVEIAARERMIIDRSYAAALAASQEARQHMPQQQPQMITRTGADNAGSFVIVQDQGVVGERPWITVGEHLRAQHMQQKVLEAQNLQQQNLSQPMSSSSTGQASDSMTPPDSAKVLLNNNNEMLPEEHKAEEAERLDEENDLNSQDPVNQYSSETKPSLASYKCNVITRLPISQPAPVMRCSSTVEQKPIYE
ncbi:unnamed protein product, partial [Strongylus vulgaris]